jgi:hypothetical protein
VSAGLPMSSRLPALPLLDLPLLLQFVGMNAILVFFFHGTAEGIIEAVYIAPKVRVGVCVLIAYLPIHAFVHVRLDDCKQ